MITILTPTRDRAVMFERLVKSLIENQEDGIPWELIALMDDDDPAISEYDKVIERYGNVRRHLCGVHPMQSTKYNLIAPMVDSEIFGCCDDDIVCEAKGWNRMVIDRAEPDGLWLANAGTGEAFFFGRGVYEFFGWITPPQIGHYWAITWPKDVIGSLNGADIPAMFVEYPQEEDATHQWLLRDGHRHIAADGNAYNAGAVEREDQKIRLKALKESLKK